MRTLTNDAALATDWLLSTDQGHYALTLVIAFLMGCTLGGLFG